MFSNNSNTQYISVVKYNNQLKIDYIIFNKNETVFSDKLSFVLSHNYISGDVIVKLNDLQKKNRDTSLITMCNSHDQLVISKEEKFKKREYKSVVLNASFNIVIKKSVLREFCKYFHKTKLDFVYSPFHILNLYIEENSHGNNLFTLILDDYLYVLIVNSHNEILYSSVKKLTSFSDIKNSKFYENDVEKQKLFDEVYYLEIQVIIQSSIQQFYMLQKNFFIEEITILYTSKQLNEKQISCLVNDIFIDIKYNFISINESLFKLTKEKSSFSKNFIEPRKKGRLTMLLKLFSLLVIVTSIVFLSSYFYTFHDIREFISTKYISFIEKNTMGEIDNREKNYLLPNHVVKNREIEKRVLNIFDLVPLDVVLQELILNEDSSIIEATFLNEDIYIKSMKDLLSQLYEYSEIKFEDLNATVLNGIIFNQRVIEQSNYHDSYPEYIKDDFISKQRVYEQLKSLFPKNSIIKFISSSNLDVTIYNYTINIIVDTPLEFFELIEDINKELYSINIAYPLIMRKTIDAIEVEFNLQFHQ